jgi:hypothetical protein
MSLWGVNVFEKRSVNENEVEYLNFKIFKRNYGFYGISVKNNFLVAFIFICIIDAQWTLRLRVAES